MKEKISNPNDIYNCTNQSEITKQPDNIRHGKWKYPRRYCWLFVCSECGVDGGFLKKEYCPNCGAKMDLK